MFYYLFYFVTLLNGLVLIAALLVAKENRLPNFLFSALLATGLYTQGVVAFLMTGDNVQYSYLLASRFSGQLLMPVLFYLYVLGLTVPGFKWARRHWLHFLPFMLSLLVFLIFVAFPDKTDIWRENRNSIIMGRYITLTVTVLVTGVYLAGSFRQLQRFQKIIPDYFSNLARIRLRWLRVLLGLFTIPWLISLADVMTGPSVILLEKVIVPIVTVLILIMGFFALKQSVIFSGEETWENSGKAPAPQILTPVEKITAKAVYYSPEKLAQWKDKLEKYIETKKSYMEPDFRLIDLAHGLGIKSYQVSEILNRGVGLTFYDFINRYRIEEAKRLLQDPATVNLTILSIAMDCGYNSKSTFNDSFRKITGMTPSQFRNSSLPKSA